MDFEVYNMRKLKERCMASDFEVYNVFMSKVKCIVKELGGFSQ